MSNRLFQGVIHQMRDATDRTIGVIDEGGVVIACSELGKIGETRVGIREELSYSGDAVALNGYTYRAIGQGTKLDQIVFVEGDDKAAASTASSRRDETVPRICFVFCSGASSAESGICSRCSRVRPASVRFCRT